MTSDDAPETRDEWHLKLRSGATIPIPIQEPDNVGQLETAASNAAQAAARWTVDARDRNDPADALCSLQAAQLALEVYTRAKELATRGGGDPRRQPEATSPVPGCSCTGCLAARGPLVGERKQVTGW